MKHNEPNSEIIIYQSEGDEPKIEVRLTGEEENELDESSTCRNFRQVRTEGKPRGRA